MLTPRRLIITDGSPQALAGLAIQDRPDQAVFWVPDLTHRAAPRRLDAIARQASHFRVDRIVGPGKTRAGQTTAQRRQGDSALEDAAVLVAALIDARDLRCSRVVWPIQAGLDLDRMAAAHEVVMCAAHLAALDVASGELSPEIRTPVLDCTDEQVVDLVTGSHATMALAWWCEHETPEPCGVCQSCQRWSSAQRTHAVA